MNTVKVRDIEIGAGAPKIIVPIVGVIIKDIIEEAKTFHSIPVDVVEWRVDWFENVFDIEWVDGVTYGDVFHTNEVEQSFYNFQVADTALLFDLFDKYEAEAKRVIEAGYIRPAYDYVLICSHTFNLLDSRGAISVSERTAFIGRVRAMARLCAADYVELREKLGFPLLKGENK